METLNANDLDFILESLKYTKLNFEESQKYPSYEYKQERIKEVTNIMAKVSAIKNKIGQNK